MNSEDKNQIFKFLNIIVLYYNYFKLIVITQEWTSNLNPDLMFSVQRVSSIIKETSWSREHSFNRRKIFSSVSMLQKGDTIQSIDTVRKSKIKYFEEMRNFLSLYFWKLSVIYSFIDFFTLQITWGTCLGRFIIINTRHKFFFLFHFYFQPAAVITSTAAAWFFP